MAKPPVSEKDAGRLLARVYEMALDGIPKVSQPVDDLAREYLERHGDPEAAARALVRSQVLKCGTSGFLTGIGGAITLPVAVPANITSVLYVQLRMVAAIARIAGHDLRSDAVQTMVFACLLGSKASDVLKKAGVELGMRWTEAALAKLAGSALVALNQRIGLRFLAGFGEKGALSLGKAVPLAGGLVGGGMDALSTHLIGTFAIRRLLTGEPVPDEPTAEDLRAYESIWKRSAKRIEAGAQGAARGAARVREGIGASAKAVAQGAKRVGDGAGAGVRLAARGAKRVGSALGNGARSAIRGAREPESRAVRSGGRPAGTGYVRVPSADEAQSARPPSLPTPPPPAEGPDER